MPGHSEFVCYLYFVHALKLNIDERSSSKPLTRGTKNDVSIKGPVYIKA